MVFSPFGTSKATLVLNFESYLFLGLMNNLLLHELAKLTHEMDQL